MLEITRVRVLLNWPQNDPIVCSHFTLERYETTLMLTGHPLSGSQLPGRPADNIVSIKISGVTINRILD